MTVEELENDFFNTCSLCLDNDELVNEFCRLKGLKRPDKRSLIKIQIGNACGYDAGIWKTQYFLVLCDNILLISDDPCYNEFSLIKDVCEIFEDKIESFKNKIYKEIEGVIVKDTYSKGKNAGLRKAIAFLKDMSS